MTNREIMPETPSGSPIANATHRHTSRRAHAAPPSPAMPSSPMPTSVSQAAMPYPPGLCVKVVSRCKTSRFAPEHGPHTALGGGPARGAGSGKPPKIRFRLAPRSYRRWPFIGALMGLRGNTGGGFCRPAVAAPATVSGEPFRKQPLELDPGRQRSARTREPGDLPVNRVAVGCIGRGVPVPWRLTSER